MFYLFQRGNLKIPRSKVKISCFLSLTFFIENWNFVFYLEIFIFFSHSILIFHVQNLKFHCSIFIVRTWKFLEFWFLNTTFWDSTFKTDLENWSKFRKNVIFDIVFRCQRRSPMGPNKALPSSNNHPNYHYNNPSPSSHLAPRSPPNRTPSSPLPLQSLSHAKTAQSQETYAPQPKTQLSQIPQ